MHHHGRQDVLSAEFTAFELDWRPGSQERIHNSIVNLDKLGMVVHACKSQQLGGKGKHISVSQRPD